MRIKFENVYSRWGHPYKEIVCKTLIFGSNPNEINEMYSQLINSTHSDGITRSLSSLIISCNNNYVATLANENSKISIIIANVLEHYITSSEDSWLSFDIIIRCSNESMEKKLLRYMDTRPNIITSFSINEDGIEFNYELGGNMKYRSVKRPSYSQYYYVMGGRHNGKSQRVALEYVKAMYAGMCMNNAPGCIGINIDKILFAGKDQITDTIVIFSDGSKTRCSILNEKGKISGHWDDSIGVMVCIAKRFGFKHVNIAEAVNKEYDALRYLGRDAMMTKQDIWSMFIVNEAKKFYGVYSTQRLRGKLEDDINTKSHINLSKKYSKEND